MSYEQDRADYEYLASIAEVEDLVEIDAAVFDLMRQPTKKKAAELYRSAIIRWFHENGEDYGDAIDVNEIADRHNIDFWVPSHPTARAADEGEGR